MLPVLTATKLVVGFVASAGVSKVAVEIIKNNTTTVTKTGKILIVVGSFAITSMTSEATVNHIDRMVQSVRDSRKKTEDEEGTTEEE